MIGNHAVCVKPIMYCRFILGFTQNLHSSRLFINLYPIILATTVLMFAYFKMTGLVLLHKYLIIGEYLVYVLVSLITKDKYINSYFKYLRTIDSFPGALKPHRKFEIFAILSILFSIGFRVFPLASIFYSAPGLFFSTESVEIYILYFFIFAIDMGRLTMALCFGLLYYRSKVLKMAFKAIDFNVSLRNRSAVNMFIQMYETLADTLKDVAPPLKLLTVVSLLNALMGTTYEVSLKLTYIKQYGPNGINVTDWLIVQSLFSFLTAAVALDLTADNMTDIQVMCVEKTILCTSERDRCGMKKILQLLKHRPLSFTVLGTKPLSVYILLSCISFFILNIIAIMQIKSFYA